VGVVLGAILAGGVRRYLRPAAPPRAISRFAFSFPSPGEQPTATGGFPLRDFPGVVISPDGTKLAYLASRGDTIQVFLRPMDRVESQALGGTAGATSPFFSPDGEWVGFFADGKLKKFRSTEEIQ
jgi:WD40-like Beta Propeller Repeat